MEEKKLLTLDDFILQNKIGSGSFGKVHKVKERRTGIIYAAKLSKTILDQNSNNANLDIFREIDIMSKLNHPSVLKFITYSPINFKKKSKPVIITEFASNGSLGDLIAMQRTGDKMNVNFDDTQKLIIIYGVASGMSYLHDHDIIHRDLKPDNILIDDFLFPRIADFGLSKITHPNEKRMSNSTLGSIKGTPLYMAPEVWKNAEYTKACDVYAFSLILYEIITNDQPFKNFNFFEISIKVIQGYRPEFLKEIPDSYKNLIQICWNEDPKKRPSFSDILNQLRNDRGFITDQINEEKYKKYVKFIDNHKVSFNEFVRPVDFKSVKVNELPDKIIENIDSLLFISKLFPFKKFTELNEECKKMVQEAEDDPKKQYEIGLHLIKCQYFFPYDTELGIKYLKKSIEGGCKDALKYYIKMLIKGKIIPQNTKKARKLINEKLKGDNGTYYLLLGLLEKKEKEYFKAIQYFKKSIDEGNCDALCEYGTMILEGNGLQSDKEEAFQFYQKAADKGCVKALFLMGKILAIDLEYVNTLDDDDGIQFLKLAADKGNSKAQYNYGYMIEDDDIDTDDDMESFINIRNSAIQGNVQAMEYLFHNFFGEEDFPYQNELLYFLKCACDKGNLDLMYYYGRLVINGGMGIKANPKEGAKYIKIAAENGVSEAITTYGQLLLLGIGVDIDKEQALEFFLKGIENDDSDSIYYYATMLKNGDTVPSDLENAIKYLKISIDKGSSLAMHYYADMLSKGDGVPVNKEEAIKYYKMAAKKGRIESMNVYANMLSNGDGVPVNKEKAVKYYKRAIDNGSDDAMFNYAMMLLEDDEVPSNKEEAFKYLKILINNGDKDAIYFYATMLSEGDLIEQNDEEAIKYLKIAIDKGQTSAMYYLGKLLLEGNGVYMNEEEGMKYLNMSIEKGNVKAIECYGDMLFTGNCVEMNKEEGIRYYKMAADAGSDKAMRIYADKLANGDGVKMNKEEALKYYKMAADTGDISAIKVYALHLARESGTMDNMDKSIKYFKIAINKGDLESILFYAKMLFMGIGVEMNKREAIEYLMMSVEKGYPDALFYYAELLEDGDYVEMNKDEAMKYYKMASEKGCSEAKNKYRYLKKAQIIDRSKSMPSLNKFLLSYYNKVDEKGKYCLLNSENNDAQSSFYIAQSLGNGENNFPQNYEDGLKYLEKACKLKNFEAIEIYIDILKKDYSISKGSEIFDLTDDFITIANLTKLKIKFVDTLLSKETFDINKDNININYVLAKKICKECADIGCIQAIVKYAYLCMKEKSNKLGEIHNDFRESFHYFRIAASKGNADGMAQYGKFIEFGFGVTKKNPEEACQYYKHAYEKGDLGGYALYGMSLIEGKTKNIPEGIRLIKYSCDQKNILGITYYAHYLFVGLPGLPEDKQMSFYYNKIAAEMGSAKSLRDIGILYKEGHECVEKDINKSIKYFKMAIEEGDIYAAYILGDLFYNGDEESEIEPDLALGIKYLEYAADHGNEPAMLDYILNSLNGMEVNIRKLVNYFNMGLELQNNSIIYLYGLSLYHGIKLFCDVKKGAKYIKMAADLGDKEAIETYIELLENGIGVEKNLEEAKKYREMIDNDDIS